MTEGNNLVVIVSLGGHVDHMAPVINKTVTETLQIISNDWFRNYH